MHLEFGYGKAYLVFIVAFTFTFILSASVFAQSAIIKVDIISDDVAGILGSINLILILGLAVFAFLISKKFGGEIGKAWKYVVASLIFLALSTTESILRGVGLIDIPNFRLLLYFLFVAFMFAGLLKLYNAITVKNIVPSPKIITKLIHRNKKPKSKTVY